MVTSLGFSVVEEDVATMVGSVPCVMITVRGRDLFFLGSRARRRAIEGMSFV